jgi:hypothetical protein
LFIRETKERTAAKDLEWTVLTQQGQSIHPKNGVWWDGDEMECIYAMLGSRSDDQWHVLG